MSAQYTVPKILSISYPYQCLFAPSAQKGMGREKIWWYFDVLGVCSTFSLWIKYVSELVFCPYSSLRIGWKIRFSDSLLHGKLIYGPWSYEQQYTTYNWLNQLVYDWEIFIFMLIGISWRPWLWRTVKISDYLDVM